MDPGVKQQPPIFDPQRVGRLRGNGLRRRPGQQDDRVGQHDRPDQVELGRLDDRQQILARKDVGLAVRHPQPEAGDPGVLLDHPAQNPRRHQQRPRIDGVDRLLQLGQAQRSARLCHRRLGGTRHGRYWFSPSTSLRTSSET